MTHLLELIIVVLLVILTLAIMMSILCGIRGESHLIRFLCSIGISLFGS